MEVHVTPVVRRQPLDYFGSGEGAVGAALVLVDVTDHAVGGLLVSDRGVKVHGGVHVSRRVGETNTCISQPVQLT